MKFLENLIRGHFCFHQQKIVIRGYKIHHKLAVMIIMMKTAIVIICIFLSVVYMCRSVFFLVFIVTLKCVGLIIPILYMKELRLRIFNLSELFGLLNKNRAGF